MTPDEFAAWFFKSHRALVAEMLRYAQGIDGAGIEDVEDSLAWVCTQFHRVDGRYLDRVVNGDPPRMRRRDGGPPGTLFAYVLAVARNGMIAAIQARRVVNGYLRDGLTEPDRSRSPVEELHIELRTCWLSLDESGQRVFQKSLCRHESLNPTERTQIASARRALRLCLIERGVDWAELIDVATDLHSMICAPTHTD